MIFGRRLSVLCCYLSRRWIRYSCMMELHSKCRNNQYVAPSGEGQIVVNRLEVPDARVSWTEPWLTYRPPKFTAPSLNNKPWADPEIGSPGFHPQWNKMDGGVQRESLFRRYEVREGYPLNPSGRTGLAGRGRLGRWGPNHAVDAVLTRWKLSVSGEKVISAVSGRPVMQLVAIQRRDTGEWALPGGMIDKGEPPEEAVKREFLEEALDAQNVAEFFSSELGKDFKEFLDKGKMAFKGYVDDPRNTDNAWMETTAYLFHDEDNTIVSHLELKGGDDASKAQWVDVSGELSLYASHSLIVKEVVSLLGAHW